MSFRWLLPLLALSLLALAATCNDGGPPPAGSGVKGLVTIGPMCPVERVESPCPDQPYQATIVIEDAGGQEAARVTSGEDGRFSVALAPGVYTLVPQSPNAGGPPFAPEQTVEVADGAYTQVEIQYDSGIR